MISGVLPNSWGRSFTVSPNGNDGNAGTPAQPWKTLAKANRTLAAGDTVFIMAGTYTDPIKPVNSGSNGMPMVYTNYQSQVCSLYVNTIAIELSEQSYVIIQGLRVQTAPSVNNSVVSVSGGAHNAILSCRIYGGSTHNTAGWGDWPAIKLSSTSYNRFLGNFCDRQDHDITGDDFRGDGIDLFGSSFYNIIEGNTVVNVSHFGISVPYDVPGDSYNIVRNNRVYNCHVGVGNTDRTSRCLYEGNIAWAPGQVNTYRGGISCEFSPRNCIIRYNAFYDDSSSVGSLQRNPGSNNGYVTNTAVSTPIDNRVYHNVFMGKSGTAADRFSLLMQNDNPGVWDFGRNVFVNNIIAYPNDRPGSYPISWQDRGKSFSTVSDTFRCNLLWSGLPESVVANWGVAGSVDYHLTLAQLQARMPEVWGTSNFEASPLWKDSVTTRDRRDFSLSAGSPCVDRAVPLTMTVRPIESSNAVYVSDASYFHYAWGDSPYDRGDSIMVDGIRAELSRVDYANNILYTANALSAGANRGVYVIATYSSISGYQSRMKGDAPDVGCSECNDITPVTTAPTSPLIANLSAGNGPVPNSAQLQWSNPLTALSYQLQISTTATFTNNFVDETGITGTIYPIAALGLDTRYYWRVRAFNRVGPSGWSAVSQFTTVAASGLSEKAGINVLGNGDFENGLTNWRFYTNGAGSLATSSPSYDGSHAAKVCITQTGNNEQFYQVGIHVESYTRYRLSFMARSSSGHDFNVSLLEGVTPYLNYGLASYAVDVDSIWREQVIDFTTPKLGQSMDDGCLRFWFPSYASAGDEYMIDNVLLTLIASESVNGPEAGYPTSCSLLQNYPNPFNPSTTIRYGLPQRSHVTLTVYNSLGQQVVQLVNGELASGYHEAKFDASELSSGVYFYRMVVRSLDFAVGGDAKSGAGDFVQAKRLVVLR
jgi:ribosomal protein S12